jgi:hypothetical protein
LENGSQITTLQYGGGAAFANAGRLNFSTISGSPLATLGDAVNNSGTVSINSGTLALNSAYVQPAGLTLLNGGNIQNSLPLMIQGGTLGGAGTISGSVTNNGVVSPGKPLGTLSIGGNYVQASGGALDINVGGTAPGTGYSLLAVSSNAVLAGTLNVALTNGYYPANTNTLYAFLTAKPVSGTFGGFFYPSSQVGMKVDYATNDAALQITNLGPTPSQVSFSGLGHVSGKFAVTVGAATAPYVVETSTNLVQWVSLYTNYSPAAPFQFSDPLATNSNARFYRVRPAQ